MRVIAAEMLDKPYASSLAKKEANKGRQQLPPASNCSRQYYQPLLLGMLQGPALGQQLHGAGLPGKGPGPQQPAPDRFGLLGLLSVIRWVLRCEPAHLSQHC